MPKRKARDEDLQIGDAPHSINPYEVLDIAKDATAENIKSAYRKAALKHHPDKVASEDKSAAHLKFQEIAFAYAILSDERRRRIYDTTGRTEESVDLDDDDFDWGTFFREQFREVVTGDAIESFSKRYKGSDEEEADVLHAYTKHKGNMTKLYEEVMLSDMVEDEDRFRGLIDRAISTAKVDSFPKYSLESAESRQKRIARAVKAKEREAKEAEKAAKETEVSQAKTPRDGSAKGNGEGDLDGLSAMIQSRQKARAEGFLAGLEAKYSQAANGKKSTKQTKMDEPPEEAFAKNARLKSDTSRGVENARNTKRSDR